MFRVPAPIPAAEKWRHVIQSRSRRHGDPIGLSHWFKHWLKTDLVIRYMIVKSNLLSSNLFNYHLVTKYNIWLLSSGYYDC